ncbi:hypothetical protein B296_00002681 [Ensete ventricosum]|uniref:Uncharacterized protein n=1 Tax=Ensete ventricosum TaxID=4639 RepID=A0A427B1N1_ENSVE|nr:hypothetical protein B296_00002681 [Ensete ventricosum]
MVEYCPSPHLRLPGPPSPHQRGVLHEAVFLVLHSCNISLDEQRHFRGRIPSPSSALYLPTAVVYISVPIAHSSIYYCSWLLADLPQSMICRGFHSHHLWLSLVFSFTSTPAVAIGGVLAPRYTRMRPGLVLSASTPSLFCFSCPSSFSSSINLTPVAVSPTAHTSTSLHCRFRHRDPYNCPLLQHPYYFIEIDAAVLNCCNFKKQKHQPIEVSLHQF